MEVSGLPETIVPAAEEVLNLLCDLTGSLFPPVADLSGETPRSRETGFRNTPFLSYVVARAMFY